MKTRTVTYFTSQSTGISISWNRTSQNFSYLDSVLISNQTTNKSAIFQVQQPRLNWAEIPFRRVSEQVAANFGSIWDD